MNNMDIKKMKKPKYRINKAVYRNEYGKDCESYYFVEKYTPILFFSRWKEIKHTSYDMMYGDDEVVTQFSTEIDARKFVEGVLCKGVITCGWEYTTVSECECNTENFEIIY